MVLGLGFCACQALRPLLALLPIFADSKVGRYSRQDGQAKRKVHAKAGCMWGESCRCRCQASTLLPCKIAAAGPVGDRLV